MERWGDREKGRGGDKPMTRRGDREMGDKEIGG
jgi:hypothetical protein